MSYRDMPRAFPNSNPTASECFCWVQADDPAEVYRQILEAGTIQDAKRTENGNLIIRINNRTFRQGGTQGQHWFYERGLSPSYFGTVMSLLKHPEYINILDYISANLKGA